MPAVAVASRTGNKYFIGELVFGNLKTNLILERVASQLIVELGKSTLKSRATSHAWSWLNSNSSAPANALESAEAFNRCCFTNVSLIDPKIGSEDNSARTKASIKIVACPESFTFSNWIFRISQTHRKLVPVEHELLQSR